MLRAGSCGSGILLRACFSHSASLTVPWSLKRGIIKEWSDTLSFYISQKEENERFPTSVEITASFSE